MIGDWGRAMLEALGLFVAAIATAAVLLARWRKSTRARRIVARACVVLASLAATLLALEVVFRFFVVQSDTWAFTLANKRWFEEHWRENALGYRDREVDVAALARKRVIAVLGDSFAAGQGIDDPRDRFSDRLEAKLGEPWAVVSVARCGWDTDQERAAIRAFPRAPDVLVLSYFVNDIGATAERLRVERPSLFGAPPPAALARLIESSYLANFVYWRLYRLRSSENGRAHWRWLCACYRDERVFAAHRDELDDIVRFTRERKIPLVAVVFPMLRAIDESREITDKVASLLRDRGARVIDLAPRLAGRDSSALTANAVDYHASVALHAEVAELLAAEIASVDSRSN